MEAHGSLVLEVVNHGREEMGLNGANLRLVCGSLIKDSTALYCEHFQTKQVGAQDEAEHCADREDHPYELEALLGPALIRLLV